MGLRVRHLVFVKWSKIQALFSPRYSKGKSRGKSWTLLKQRDEVPTLDLKEGFTVCICTGGIHCSKKLQMHLGEDPWNSQVWRKQHDDWPRVNKQLEGLSYINDSHHLWTELPLTQDAHTLISGCVSLPRSELDNLFPVCAPIACAVPLINRVPIFTVFASLKHSCFQRVARARATLLLACSPWWFRTLGFHPGYIPGQGTKISLQDCSLLSLQDQHYFPNHKRWPNTLIAPSPEISWPLRVPFQTLCY